MSNDVMTQPVQQQQQTIEDPISALLRLADREKTRINKLALAQGGEASVLRREMTGTVMSLTADLARFMREQFSIVYNTLGLHANQLESIEDQLAGAVTVITPEDAEKIIGVCNAFKGLIEQLKTGQPPDAELVASQLALADEVVDLVNDAVPEDGDDDAEGDDEEGEEDAP